MRAVSTFDVGKKFPEVTFVAPQLTFVDECVTIGKGTYVEPFVVLKGNTHIGQSCKIFAHTAVEDFTSGDNCEIGGYNISGDTKIGNDCKIGRNAELKRTELGNKVNDKHFSYLGDAKVGNESNIGAGTITANYDGKEKNPTVIGSEVFLGISSKLIAKYPCLRIGDRVFIAAGLTVSEDIPACMAVMPEKITVITEKGEKLTFRAGDRFTKTIPNKQHPHHRKK